MSFLSGKGFVLSLKMITSAPPLYRTVYVHAFAIKIIIDEHAVYSNLHFHKYLKIIVTSRSCVGYFHRCSHLTIQSYNNHRLNIFNVIVCYVIHN